MEEHIKKTHEDNERLRQQQAEETRRFNAERERMQALLLETRKTYDEKLEA